MSERLIIEQHGRVLLVRLNRPEALNALNAAFGAEIIAALEAGSADPGIGAMVLTGSEKAFAAGADIKEIAAQSAGAMLAADGFSQWEKLRHLTKPVIAAVAGFALGGGCELAMMCDFIIAADSARFGQPEVRLGLMPGMGGTQRLARLVGKARATELCLTGRTVDAAEAERIGLVARTVPADRLIDEALAVAATIAGHSAPVVALIREALDHVDEGGLGAGLRAERRLFHALLALDDPREGMAAFAEKRPPQFKHS